VKSKQKLFFVWIVDPTNSKLVKSKQKSGKSNYKIFEMFRFRHFFVWISRIFEEFKQEQRNPNNNQGKSKQ
jgi:hypothetical protein